MARPSDLFEALKKAAHDHQLPLVLFDIPVRVPSPFNEEKLVGRMPVLEIVDALYTHGKITGCTLMGLVVDELDGNVDEFHVALSEIEITGDPVSL